jgi:hypothetical protein
MQDSYHIVQRHVFDIRHSEKEKAFDLHNRFSRLFSDQAVPVMEEVFGRWIPDGLVMRMETLKIDIGKIRYDRIEKDFERRFREALEKEMERLINEYVRQEAPGWNKTLMDLLEYFLFTGRLPWWAAGELLTDPVAVTERLIRDDRPGLRNILLYAGQRDHVRRRLAFQFPEAMIRAVIEVLEPEEAAFIFVYHTDIIRIQEAGQVFRQETSEFGKSIWVFIFTYLLVDRGSNFNRKIFVKSALGQMARQFNLEYAVLLSLLFKALESTSPVLAIRSSLSGIIHTLFYEDAAGPGKKLPVSAAGLIREKIDRIRQYLLRRGRTGQGLSYDIAALSETFTGLIAQAPESAKDLIRSMSGQEGLWESIVDAFDEEVISGLIRLREPDEAEFILHYGKKLETLQREKFLVKTQSGGFHRSVWELILSFLWTDRGNLFNTRVFLEYNVRRMARRYYLSYRQLLAFLVQGIGQDIRSDRDGSLFHMLAALLKQDAEAEPAPASRESKGVEAPKKEWKESLEKERKEADRVDKKVEYRAEKQGEEDHERKNKDSDRAELAAIAGELERQMVRERDESRKRDMEKMQKEGPVYIGNAGLVLLHPLLFHFFDRLGLTEKNQFIDEEAKHRSAHLLQFLVDSREEHPEYEMVLNKILCEIPIEEPLGLRITVTEEERALAMELLEVVKQRWEKMENTSVEGLQLSFLQRGGALTRMHDGWKLRVEQKGIDVLLQYLPWSWGMIRLPWMSKILYVEWI